MKARLVPVYFVKGRDVDFDLQLGRLKALLKEEAEFLEPTGLGSSLPEGDAVVFPQLLGEAYRLVATFKAIPLPILIITSEFGTVSMWDWEIRRYLKSEGVETIAPYNLEQTKTICRALGVRRGLLQTKLLVYQDRPAENGFQDSIFKRFYWFEDECQQRMVDKFGITLEKKSLQKLGETAKAIPDQEAEAVWKEWHLHTDVTPRALKSAIKIYMAVKRDLEQDASIGAVGINCLNESHFSDTTPCLAWNMLYEEKKMIWGCEGDSVSMLTKYILHKSLGVPIMMTNLYPFLMGQAALKHEKIPHFPEVLDPENHILAAHCGYLGVVPVSFATEWTLKPKVLAIVDDNASAIDARLPEGDMTLAKLDPRMERFTVAEGSLKDYAQYPGSDCRNGAVLRVQNGKRMLENLASHHYLLMTGHNGEDIELVGKVFGLGVEAF